MSGPFDHQGLPFSGQSTFILLCRARWPYHRANPSSPARPLYQRVQQFLDVDPIRLCPTAASVHGNRGGVDHMAFHAVRLQQAVYPETVETGFMDRNNPHRRAAGSLRSGLQPLQQGNKSSCIRCRHLPEAIWFESRCQGGFLQLGVVVLFSLGGRHVADRLNEATMVEPVDPFERGELDSFERAPGPAPSDDLSLE